MGKESLREDLLSISLCGVFELGASTGTNLTHTLLYCSPVPPLQSVLQCTQQTRLHQVHTFPSLRMHLSWTQETRSFHARAFPYRVCLNGQRQKHMDTIRDPPRLRKQYVLSLSHTNLHGVFVWWNMHSYVDVNLGWRVTNGKIGYR